MDTKEKSQNIVETKKRQLSQRLNLLLPEEIELLTEECGVNKDFWVGYLIGNMMRLIEY